jgi:hypothetical protein
VTIVEDIEWKRSAAQRIDDVLDAAAALSRPLSKAQLIAGMPHVLVLATAGLVWCLTDERIDSDPGLQTARFFASTCNAIYSLGKALSADSPASFRASCEAFAASAQAADDAVSELFARLPTLTERID